MQQDHLKELLGHIEAFCRERQIAPFYGTVEETDLPLVLWDRDESQDWQSYLTALKNTATRILTISITENEFGESEDQATAFLATLGPEEQQAYQGAIRGLQQVKGQVAHLALTFFEAGVAYQYEKYAPWIDQYLTWRSFQEKEPGEDFGKEKEAAVSVQLIEQVARQVLASPEYLAAPNRFEKRKVVATQLQSQGIEDRTAIGKIFTTVEALYQQEVRPALERELKTKIQQLQQQGFKKVEVSARLGLCERAVNKHWY